MNENKIKSFWSKVDIRSENECWRWMSGYFEVGYGAFYLDGNNRGAHRVAKAIDLNVPLSEIKYACHTCDNRWCVNPKHIFNGTQQDNVDDMMSKGRQVKPFAERDHCSKGHVYDDVGFWVRKRNTKYGILESRVCKKCDQLRGIKRRIKRGQNVSRSIV